MSKSKQALGTRGERIAERLLISKGWVILERRFRNGHRDVDIIAAQPDPGGRVVAFVEVKTRKSSSFGGPLGAVNWKKQRELHRSAKIWIARHGQSGDTFRFDVIGLLLEPGRVRVQHVENAFMLPTRV